MENLNRISYGLRNGLYNTNPHDCANDLAVLAGEYAFIMGRLEEILQRKPAVWTEKMCIRDRLYTILISVNLLQ